MHIVVTLRDVYGVIKAYPACPKARCFADIAGTTTLTPSTLRLVATLGYRVVLADAFGKATETEVAA